VLSHETAEAGIPRLARNSLTVITGSNERNMLQLFMAVKLQIIFFCDCLFITFTIQNCQIMRSFPVISLFLLAMSLQAQVVFDDHFTDRTMRFDFMMAGNSETTKVYPVSFREEPFWGGSLTTSPIRSVTATSGTRSLTPQPAI
jgi:hypothetical protein